MLSSTTSSPSSSSPPLTRPQSHSHSHSHSNMTLNVLSYHHQAHVPATGMCQAAPHLVHSHSSTSCSSGNTTSIAQSNLKRSSTTLSSAHRLRSRLLSQDPTLVALASDRTGEPQRTRPRSPAREALHSVASSIKHLHSASSRSAALARSKSSHSHPAKPNVVPTAAAAPVNVAAQPAVPACCSTSSTQGGLANPHLIVATLLVRIAQANDALLARATPLAATDRGAAALLAAASKFQGRAPPTISLPAYAARLARYAPVPAAVWVATLIAIDRVANAPTASPSNTVEGTVVPPVVVCSHNVHRVLLLALSIATKVHSDAFYTNKHLAKVGGVGLPELNRLELEFLFLSGFNVNVSSAEYTRYTERLAAYASAVQQQWTARATAADGGAQRVHSVPAAPALPVTHLHAAKSAPAALGALISPPCSPTPSCASTDSSTSSAMSCYSAGAVVCTAPQQKQVVWSTPPMSPPRRLMASDPIVLSPMAVDQ